MCVCVRERECVCVCERESVCVCERDRESVSVCFVLQYSSVVTCYGGRG